VEQALAGAADGARYQTTGAGSGSGSGRRPKRSPRKTKAAAAATIAVQRMDSSRTILDSLPRNDTLARGAAVSEAAHLPEIPPTVNQRVTLRALSLGIAPVDTPVSQSEPAARQLERAAGAIRAKTRPTTGISTPSPTSAHGEQGIAAINAGDRSQQVAMDVDMDIGAQTDGIKVSVSESLAKTAPLSDPLAVYSTPPSDGIADPWYDAATAPRPGTILMTGADPDGDFSVAESSSVTDSATPGTRIARFPWVAPDGGVYTQPWTEEVPRPPVELGASAWLVDNETIPSE